MSGFAIRSLGSFEVPSGRLVVADPCYFDNRDWGVVIDNAKPGRWIVLAGVGSWVSSVFAFHESDGVRDSVDDHELTFFCGGIDSGRVAIVDSQSIKCYEDAKLKPGFECDPFGVMVQSGIGDGIYCCAVREFAGQAVSVRIDFDDSGVIQ